MFFFQKIFTTALFAVFSFGAGNLTLAGQIGDCNEPTFFETNEVLCNEVGELATTSTRSLAVNEFIADKADVISSRPMLEYLYAPNYPNAKLQGYLTFVHSWIEEERKDYAGVYGLVNWLVPYRAPVNKIIFFLKPVWNIQNDVVVFSNLPHPHPKKSIVIQPDSLHSDYAEACGSEIFNQKILPKPSYILAVQTDEGNESRSLIENGASSDQINEFLMRCEFELEGIFIESKGGEAPIFRITNVLSFKKHENFLEQIWSEVEQPHETQER